MPKVMLVLILVLFYLYNCVICLNNRPVIGILTQESKPWDEFGKNSTSYISASYVKAVEAAGARVVPVFINKPVNYYNETAKQLNGFIFPGGASNITSDEGYARSALLIYKNVKRLNKEGVNVPILGICLGMEILGLITSGMDLRTPCPVKNEALSLQFRPNYRNSSLFRDASDFDINILSNYNSTSNHHRYCLTEDTLKSKKVKNWTILTTSKGGKSDVFISSMEITNLPIAALIFHPEKNAYEWEPKQDNPHDEKSIKAVRLFYDWLVKESRKNKNSYGDEDTLLKNLIYNYKPTFSGKKFKYDFQNYYFK